MGARRQRFLRTVLVAAACAAAIGGMHAARAASTSERLDALERKVDSRGLIDLLSRVDQLQRDIQKLHGDIEVQNHLLDDIQRRQREQYLDIDRRLQQLETGNPPAAAAGAAAGAAGTVPPSAAATQPPVTGAPGGALPGAAAAATDAADLAAQQAEYDTALAVLRDGRYSDAALAFNRFITRYPAGPLTDNAYYWLGETYYVTRDFGKAKSTFGKLVSNFPGSQKVADSRLKIGFVHYEQKEWKAARTELEAVASSYPATTAARLASERLERMKKEGH